jgi:hypothetical protein
VCSYGGNHETFNVKTLTEFRAYFIFIIIFLIKIEKIFPYYIVSHILHLLIKYLKTFYFVEFVYLNSYISFFNSQISLINNYTLAKTLKCLTCLVDTIRIRNVLFEYVQYYNLQN